MLDSAGRPVKHARDVARALPGSCGACRPSDPEGRRDGESTNRRAQNQAQAQGQAEAQADTAPAEADPQLRAFARARGRLADRHRRGRRRPRSRRRRVPARKDLRQSWWRIQDQGSTGSCVGWAAADGVLRWHFVKAGRIADERAAVAALPVDRGEGDGRLQHAPDDVRRGGGDEPEGGPRRRAQVRRRQGPRPPVRVGAPYQGTRRRSTRSRRSSRSACTSTSAATRALASVAGDEGADPDPARRRLDVGEGDGDQREPRAVPAADAKGGHAVTLVGYTPERSSSGTAGARGGATAASPTPHSATRRRLSPRPTASSRRARRRWGAGLARAPARPASGGPARRGRSSRASP